MKWGIWEREGEGLRVLHVAPVGLDEEIAAGHRLSSDCPCGPALIEDHDRDIWVHEVIQ